MIRHAPSIGIGIGLSLRSTAFGSSAPFSPEALNYFSRLDAAGDTTYVDYKQPLANYIDSLVTLGGAYWDDMESSTSFVGVGIQGVTVPLRDGMTVPTQNNFVVGDLDQLAGLKSNGSTKYIDTGLVGTDLTLNDASWSCNITVAGSYIGVDYLMGSGVNESGAMNFLSVNGVNMESRVQAQARSIIYTGSVLNKTGFLGVSRSSSAAFDWQFDSVGGTNAVASNSPAPTSAFSVFGASNFVSNDNRLATYHIGPALNLATLEGLQATLLSEVAAAKGAAAAANYFARLVTAGDTTHTAYKTPITNYFTGLFQNNLWDKLESSALFVGVGIQGVTVPLKSTMTALTNNNFVAGDLDPLTGLKGDGSTKYLDTGSKFNDFPQNDFSMSCNITEFIQETTDGNYLAYQSFGDGISQISTQNDQGVNPNNLITRCNTRNGEINFDIGNLEDLYGINRTVSTEYSVQYGASSKTVTEPSQAPANQIISILGASTEVKSNARMATYHIGPALNLATLRGLQATLLSEIAAI